MEGYGVVILFIMSPLSPFSSQAASRCLVSSGRRSPSTPAPPRLTPRRYWPRPRCRMTSLRSWTWTSCPWRPSMQDSYLTSGGMMTTAATTTNGSARFPSCLTTLSCRRWPRTSTTSTRRCPSHTSRRSTPAWRHTAAYPRLGTEHHRLHRFVIVVSTNHRVKI